MSVEPDSELGLGDRRDPPTTLQGWRRFVDAEPARFELLPEAQWAKLGPAERIGYDEARIDYHSETVIVATPPSGR